MTIGSRGEKLTDVFPDILEKLKKNKAKGLQMFTATESRGIEDDVLAAADSNIVEMYLAFKKSLTDKQFLEPATACADFYFEKLSQEPQLEKLHSSMRRNYAAALQDDAQQVMNVMLKTGLTQEVTKSRKAAEIFKNYPIYLERAAELLGKEHYMYSVLQARRYYFEGKIKEERPLKRSLFKKALELQPEMPHATIQLIRNSEKEQQDSALYYFEKATTALPNWTEPYIALSNYYVYKTEDKDKGIELLERALEVDSSSVFAQYQKAKAYEYFKEYDSAEKWYLKTIESTGKDICFPCALNDLGTMYFFQRKFEKAEKYMLEAYHADTTFLLPLIGLSGVYGTLGQLEKAEKTLLKILKADTTIYQVFNNMGIICQVTGRYEEALSYYSKALSLSPRDVNTIYSIASMYRELGNINEEENYLLKGFAIDSNHLYINNGLGLLENSRKNFKKAEYYFSKVLQLDSTNGPALVNLADLWSTTKSYERAKEAYEKVLTLSFRVAYPYAHRGLGAYFLRQKDYEKALFNTKKALEYNPKLPRTHILLGQVYLHLDSLDEAKIAFDQAALLTPDDPEIDLCRAMYEVNNEQPRKAWKNLRKALKKGYDNYDDLTLEELLAPLKKKHKKWNNLMQKYFPNQPKK
jgi:tetratricopeptide (TPR) repeat protein